MSPMYFNFYSIHITYFYCLSHVIHTPSYSFQATHTSPIPFNTTHTHTHLSISFCHVLSSHYLRHASHARHPRPRCVTVLPRHAALVRVTSRYNESQRDDASSSGTQWRLKGRPPPCTCSSVTAGKVLSAVTKNHGGCCGGKPGRQGLFSSGLRLLNVALSLMLKVRIGN